MPHADSSYLPEDVTTKAKLWAHIHEQLGYLIAGQRQWVSNLANASSLIYHSLASFPDFGTGDSAVNWSGFYLASEFIPHSKPDPSNPRLLLGPFCGRPACQFIRAQPGKGACADAFVNKSTVLVKDVHAYPGHIACDGGTRSEIVSPIFAADGRVVGVLDLDCLKEGGFEEVDREGVEKIAKLLGEGCDW
ncbi:Free methionine-R-sulfoxide reductase Short=fRMsr [Rhizoctonia solani AG-1 IB]|uniref:Free methionine-R-sulfoxide reductase Short=fRMsr n=1 Tax=Thanatephorus cucumeris (strain AG1-IB / isolate 7/3/14) TaxID=1108050 RepID=M5C2B6_THACB|nr:Free methionine-R-sulfoxide reductase Short=fRMsr [Rhizoctonia solani AG-1 IB]